MELTGIEVQQARPIDVAAMLIRNVGAEARSLAEQQITKSAGDETLTLLWREVASAITPLIHANLHMELALDLLDSIGETSVPPHLNYAIVRLGIRSDGADRSPPVLFDDPHADQESLHERAERHLNVAATLIDREAKALHLDMAARFATMREMKARDAT